MLADLDGKKLSPLLTRAAALLASVTGQDLDEGTGGVFRIARRVAKDRVISTVDPEARHGHKTSARGFDGYKGHVAIDPDAELITATAVTARNAGDAAAAAGLLAAELPANPGEPGSEPAPATNAPATAVPAAAADGPTGPEPGEAGETRPGSPRPGTRNSSPSTETRPTARASCWTRWSRPTRTSTARRSPRSPPVGGSPRMPSASTWRVAR